MEEAMEKKQEESRNNLRLTKESKKDIEEAMEKKQEESRNNLRLTKESKKDKENN
jgi:hypothetical protein